MTLLPVFPPAHSDAQPASLAPRADREEAEPPLAACCGAGASTEFADMLSELDERALAVVLTEPYARSLTCEQWVALWEVTGRNGVPVHVEGTPDAYGQLCAA